MKDQVSPFAQASERYTFGRGLRRLKRKHGSWSAAVSVRRTWRSAWRRHRVESTSFSRAGTTTRRGPSSTMVRQCHWCGEVHRPTCYEERHGPPLDPFSFFWHLFLPVTIVLAILGLVLSEVNR